MIPAMHRPGRHWPTMSQHVPPLVDTGAIRALPGQGWASCVIEWVAIIVLMAITVIVPIYLGAW